MENNEFKKRGGSMPADKDKCVLCWKETEYSKDTHIDLRKFYVEGSGQLCQDCHELVYGIYGANG